MAEELAYKPISGYDEELAALAAKTQTVFDYEKIEVIRGAQRTSNGVTNLYTVPEDKIFFLCSYWINTLDIGAVGNEASLYIMGGVGGMTCNVLLHIFGAPNAPVGDSLCQSLLRPAKVYSGSVIKLAQDGGGGVNGGFTGYEMRKSDLKIT